MDQPDGNSILSAQNQSLISPLGNLDFGTGQDHVQAKGIDDLTASEQSQNLLLDMINSSFMNIPQIQDQDVYSIKNHLPVNDAYRFSEGIKDREDLI